MSSKMVWSRFERIAKCGKMYKFRIQDLPPTRTSDALDLFVKYFIRDEIILKALDIHNIPAAVEDTRNHVNNALHDSSCHKVICCPDDTDEVTDIISVSVMRLYTEASYASMEREYLKKLNSAEKLELNRLKVLKIVHELSTCFNPLKEFKLDSFYSDVGVVVAPDYRRLGLVHEYARTRQLICKAHNVPMTGAWMSSGITQKATGLNGWETVHEIAYDYLAKKYDVKFVNAPPTLKYMMARGDTA